MRKGRRRRAKGEFARVLWTPRNSKMTRRYTEYYLIMSMYMCSCVHIYTCVYVRVRVCEREWEREREKEWKGENMGGRERQWVHNCLSNTPILKKQTEAPITTWCLCIYIHICISIYMYTHIKTIYLYVCINIYTNTYIYIYIHI